MFINYFHNCSCCYRLNCFFFFVFFINSINKLLWNQRASRMRTTTDRSFVFIFIAYWNSIVIRVISISIGLIIRDSNRKFFFFFTLVRKTMPWLLNEMFKLFNNQLPLLNYYRYTDCSTVPLMVSILEEKEDVEKKRQEEIWVKSLLFLCYVNFNNGWPNHI